MMYLVITVDIDINYKSKEDVVLRNKSFHVAAVDVLHDNERLDRLFHQIFVDELHHIEKHKCSTLFVLINCVILEMCRSVAYFGHCMVLRSIICRLLC